MRCALESHLLTTEGVAMMFERFADNAAWLKAMGVKSPIRQRSAGQRPSGGRTSCWSSRAGAR